MIRYRFITDLQKGMSIPIQVFSWKPGGGRGGQAVYTMWRIPRVVNDRDENKTFQLSVGCLESITMYRTWAMKCVFISEIVSPSFVSSKAVANAVYEYITGNKLPCDTSIDKGNAFRVVELSLATQDFDIATDLREMNGRPKSDTFDPCWREVDSFLTPQVRVDDRRHGNVCFMPVAMSTPDLRRQVVQRLPTNIQKVSQVLASKSLAIHGSPNNSVQNTLSCLQAYTTLVSFEWLDNCVFKSNYINKQTITSS